MRLCKWNKKSQCAPATTYSVGICDICTVSIINTQTITFSFKFGYNSTSSSNQLLMHIDGASQNIPIHYYVYYTLLYWSCDASAPWDIISNKLLAIWATKFNQSNSVTIVYSVNNKRCVYLNAIHYTVWLIWSKISLYYRKSQVYKTSFGA